MYFSKCQNMLSIVLHVFVKLTNVLYKLALSSSWSTMIIRCWPGPLWHLATLDSPMDLLPWRETSLSIRCSNNRFIFYRCQRKLGFIKLLWHVVCYDCTRPTTRCGACLVWWMLYNCMLSWWFHENPMISASQVILSVVELPAYIYAVIICLPNTF